VLGFDFTDAGGGWLIFGLPPAEVAVHPAESHGSELYLMCRDLDAERQKLAAHGVVCSEVEEARWDRWPRSDSQEAANSASTNRATRPWSTSHNCLSVGARIRATIDPTATASQSGARGPGRSCADVSRVGWRQAGGRPMSTVGGTDGSRRP
jgi:hypothetical protein